jgi:hypothetical protein
LRTAVLVALALLAAGCAEETSSGSETKGPPTSLEISVWPRGRSGPVRTWTLRCPGKSTLPRAVSACSRLAQMKRPFEPVSRFVACTQIYGGPQVAEVRGTYKGRPVTARFNRTNGCELDRWNRLGFLFPSGR